MNRSRDSRSYEDYYVTQVGGGLPVFVGARVQRGHGLGSLFGGLIRSAMPLIKRGALALGKGALKTGLGVAGDVLSGQSIKSSAKRRLKETGKDMVSKMPGSSAHGPPGIRLVRRSIASASRRYVWSVSPRNGDDRRRIQTTYLGISQPWLSSISCPVRKSRVNWTCLVYR